MCGQDDEFPGCSLVGFLSPSTDLKFSDVPNGLAAVTKAPFRVSWNHASARRRSRQPGPLKVPAVGWFQYTVFCGICDLWLCHQASARLELSLLAKRLPTKMTTDDRRK